MFEKINCPRCGQIAYRVRRRLAQRLFGYFRPVKRYRCFHCDWESAFPQPKK